MKIKKTPTRKCVGCGENIIKKDLIRIVKNKEGEIFVDTTGKANGRGVYICNSIKCLEKAKANRELEKSLKSKIGEDIYDDLKNMIAKE